MKPVLVLGGSGQAGADTTALLRRWHPDLPLTIAARNLERAQRVADDLGTATVVTVDLGRSDLGLPAGATYSAVVALLRDESYNALRYAQDHELPYFGISSGPVEIAPEVVAVAHRPTASPVMLASHFFAGAVVLAALQATGEFSRVDSIRVSAVLDEQDIGGPAALADLERWAAITSAGLVRRDGAFTWLPDTETAAEVERRDGSTLPGQTVAVLDVPSLAFATDAANVQLDFAVNPADALDGSQPAAELRIDLTGTDQAGAPLRTTHFLTHSAGQRPLTAVGIALGVERLLALRGASVPPGIHTPESLIDPAYATARLQEAGAEFVEAAVVR
ncbi:saccharopine dehydrogenase [Kribbella sp. CA-293567]|uniref:saccharopine dehydrogenase n=1 Tax=Kribbella sp. CA-293567 TaxID=3002436 RepID=UPI0022DE81A7|nr:saccharopine dehydrogenase [Kribbella sp. CA-293567]WBQ04742.1 saccharopine dehydrogenase [Kribbella sp. CA-293567]